MNKLTRLTALLLALLMIFSTFATAETAYKAGEMTLEQWNTLVENVDAIVGEPTIDKGGVAVRPEIPDQPIIGAAPAGKQYLVTTTADLSKGSVATTLYTSGRLILTGADEGQWQISVGGVWVNITGEMGATLNVTNAMVQELGTTVQVRQANAPEKIADITVMEYAATMTMVAAVRAMQTAAEEEPIPTAADDVMTIEDANQYLATINYVFEGDKPAASSYTAALGRGTPFNHSQPNPSVQGYKVNRVEVSDPTAASYDQENNAVKFNIASVQNNVVVKVVYEPAEVDYTIIHYYQNPVGNGYTQDPVNTVKKGLTGTQVPENDIAEPPTGFYSLLYDRPTIAADGSTVVEIYYDRYYYLLSFELDGGYGVEPVYARYGSDLPEIGTPIRAGYTFKGWATTADKAAAGTVDVEKLPTTMPEKHTVYYAVWEMEDEAKVTIVFWGENPNDEGYSYLQTGEVTAESGTSYTYTHGTTVNMKCELETHSHAAAGCELECGKEEHTAHDETCLTCGHMCTLDCYSAPNGGSLRSINAPSGVAAPSHNGIVTSGNNKYLYIDGTWYCVHYWTLTWWASPTTNINNNCSHGHTSECYDCELHTHTDDCYDCGLTEHTHSNSCSGALAGLNTNLWTFVRSETSTVAPDGSTTINVYYDRTEFTLHFRRANSNTDNFGTITDKWGANIEDEFDAVCDLAGYQSWSEKSNADSPWTNYIAIMPQKDMTYYSYTGSGNNRWVMTYYKETFVKGEYAVAFTVTLYRSGTTTVSKEEFLELEGFTFNADKSTKTGSSTNGAKFYYDRNTYNIEFYNPTELIRKVEGIYFEASIDDQYFVPGNEWIPSSYEPGSVYFDGWYLNPECTGEEYIFENKTMPVAPNNGDTSLVLYAKWTPNVYTVNFYLTEADKEAGIIYAPQDTEYPKASFTVSHGDRIDQEYVAAHLDRDAMNAATPPPRDPYKFVVWYYMDENNQKQVFTPNMQIKRNLDLIAEWTSDVLIPYTVKFMIKDTNTEIADPIVGSKLAGEQETFEAKGDTELYAGYQTGYFPETNSHTITFEISDDGEVTAKEYTFWYTKVDAVPYKVYYKIVDENGNILGPAIMNDGTEYIKEVNDNEKAVVTENFVVVPGYMPDAYQKRLVVTPGGENVITFYYTEDDEHAYYQVTHYTENIDKTWTEHASSQIQGDIGMTDYADDPLTIDGFRHDVDLDKYLVNGQSVEKTHALTEQGLQIEIYYTRNSYPYMVNYYLENSNTELIPSKKGPDVKGLYGETITESAVPIPGYDALDPTTQQLTIRIEETVNLNVINFYYREKVATINYVPVTSDGGTVSLGSETIGAVTGNAMGATPAAKANYTFEGWYKDEACTQPVNDAGWVDATTKKITPQKTKDYDAGVGTVLGYESATYYALFAENETTINYIPMYETANGTLTEGTTGGAVTPTSETVKVVTGKATGSTAEPVTPTYKFDGWYSDAACTVKVGDNAAFVPVKADNAIWDATNTTYYAKFVYDVGHLSITKTVVNETGYEPTKTTFDFTVMLRDANDEPLTGDVTYRVDNAAEQTKTLDDGKFTIELTATKGVSQTVVISNLLNGTTYSVTEADEDGYTPAYANAAGSIVPGSTVAATVTNTYETGNLTITKNVVGETAPENDAFTFRLTLPAGTFKYMQNGEEKTVANGGTVTLKAGESVTIEGIPADTAYAVAEEAEDKYDTSSTGRAGTIEAGETAAAVFTNTYKYGDLKIGKRVEPYGEEPDKEFAFTLELSDKVNKYAYAITDADGNTRAEGEIGNGEEFKLSEGWYITLKDIPAGTTYTVTETLVSGYATYVSLDGEVDEETGNTNIATGTIAAGEEKSVWFVNIYGLGSLNVIKNVVGSAPDEVFTFTVEVTDEYGDPLVGIFPLLITYNEMGEAAEKRDVDVSQSFSFELKNGWSALIARLPEGTKYTITETTDNTDYDTWVKTNIVSTADDEENYGEKTNAAAGSIPDTGMHQVIFTNVYQYSHLTIKKTGMQSGESAIFEVKAYSKYSNDQETTFTISVPNGKSVTIGELLIGSDYTITEIGSWSNRYSQASTVNGTIQQNGSEVTVTNSDKNNKWLHGEDYVHNDFSKPGAYAN